jgi:hypothetical protein
LEFARRFGWHGDLNDNDGCGMRIASLALAPEPTVRGIG